jgi:hypothetical protein
MYQIPAINIKQRSFSGYRFLILGAALSCISKIKTGNGWKEHVKGIWRMEEGKTVHTRTQKIQ